MSNLTAREISLTKNRCLVLPSFKERKSSPAAVATFNRNLMSLGFTCSQDLTVALFGLGDAALADLYEEVFAILKQMTGAYRRFKPMYPNFPKQVMEASEVELFENAMRHYFGAMVRDIAQGQPRLGGGKLMDGAPAVSDLDEGSLEEIAVAAHFLPEYKKEDRESLPTEEISVKIIRLGTEKDFYQIFTRLIGSNGSLSASDKAIVEWFTTNLSSGIEKNLPSAIPNKENMSYLFALLMKSEVPTYLLPYLKTATDILRVAVASSSGDVSLATPCKFRRLKRSERRFFLQAFENVTSSLTEDMLRRPEVYKRLSRELHPGEYAKNYPKAFGAFNVVCNDEPFPTFNGKVEGNLKLGDTQEATELLRTRPGDFARRLDHVLRLSQDKVDVLRTFRSVAAQVSSPVLLQAYAHFLNRNSEAKHRSFFPKGSVAKVQVAEELLPPLDKEVCAKASLILQEALVNRFESLPSLGKVYLDPALKTQFVPFAQRSASKSLRTIARGSRLALPECGAIRFFVWWKEPKGIRTDVDLAATFFDGNWTRLCDVSYYALRHEDWGCAHSGDITSAPNGACEFIDIDLKKLQGKGPRYVMMNIYCFTQQSFKDLPECYAGWMARTKVQSGEIFEAATVQDKIDIAGDTCANIPLIVDLQDRQVIWSDIALKNRNAINSGYRNRDNISRMGKALAELKKPTLYDLFFMHATARGEIVENEDQADTVFGLNTGTVTAFDTDKIMSEFMPDPPKADKATSTWKE